MIDRKREIAKFFCGFETFHALTHVYLLLTNQTLTLLGITTTPTLSVVSIILNGAIAIVLGLYGWGAWARGQSRERR